VQQWGSYTHLAKTQLGTHLPQTEAWSPSMNVQFKGCNQVLLAHHLLVGSL